MTQPHLPPQGPIKRSEALKPLSRDHHEGLLLCWKIRKGLKDDLDCQRIAAYVTTFFGQALQPHFTEEEQFVFTLLPGNEQVQTALQQHQSLKDLVNDISAYRDHCKDLLAQFADQLDQHIRFEERVLFPGIEQIASEGLEDVGKVIAAHHEQLKPISWDDQFWM